MYPPINKQHFRGFFSNLLCFVPNFRCGAKLLNYYRIDLFQRLLDARRQAGEERERQQPAEGGHAAQGRQQAIPQQEQLLQGQALQVQGLGHAHAEVQGLGHAHSEE